MKIIEKVTGKVLADILTDRAFTLDEACDFMEIPVMRTEEDYMCSNGYDIEELDLIK